MRDRRLGKCLLVVAGMMLAGPRLGLAQANAVAAQTEGAESADSDVVLHEGRWQREIETDLIAEKFDELDRMAEGYRRDKTRMPGGDWRLRYFYQALNSPQETDKDSQEHIDHLEKWMTLRPESITARIALSTSLHRWAWVARGNGFAKTVTPEGWRLFNLRIQESQVVLEGSANMRRMCPQFYSEMLTVGLAQGWDKKREREIFERGIQFEPEYFYLYNQYANYLLPKWYGKAGESSSFAKESADKLGGEAGDALYFRIVAVLVKRGDGNFPVAELDWERVQRGYRAVQAQYGAVPRDVNQLAFMAYKFHDAAVAQAQFAQIGDRWSRGVWRDKQFFDRVRDWSRGLTTQGSDS